MLTKEELPACPVATTVALIGSKWKLLIMRNLQMRTWRFNELKKDLEGISQKVLTDSLRSMEKDGCCAHGLCGSASARGIFSERAGQIHAPHYRRYGRLGQDLSANG